GAIKILLDAAKQHSDWISPLASQALMIVRHVEQQILESNNQVADQLTALQSIAELWKLPEAQLLIAEISHDPQQRQQYLQLAAQNGSSKAIALLSHEKLTKAMTDNQPELVSQALVELREAADKEQPDAL